MSHFRAAFQADLSWRVIDLLLHVTAAWALSRLGYGPWYFQWLPDVLVPVIWLQGIITDKFLADDSMLLLWHHIIGSLVVACVMLLVSTALGLHFLLHWLIDAYTHRGWRRVRLT